MARRKWVKVEPKYFSKGDWLIHLQGIAHALVTVGSGEGLELAVFSLQ